MKTLVYVGTYKGDGLAQILKQEPDYTHIWGFEPNPFVAGGVISRIPEQFRDRLRMVTAALTQAAEDEEICQYRWLKLYGVGKEEYSSSLYPLTRDAQLAFAEAGIVVRDFEASFEVLTWDAYDAFLSLHIFKIDRLVIDAQGCDYNILRSVRPMLEDSDIKTIQLEVDRPGFSHYDGPTNDFDSVMKYMSQFPHYKLRQRPTFDTPYPQADIHFDLQEE